MQLYLLICIFVNVYYVWDRVLLCKLCLLSAHDHHAKIIVLEDIYTCQSLIITKIWQSSQNKTVEIEEIGYLLKNSQNLEYMCISNFEPYHIYV